MIIHLLFIITLIIVIELINKSNLIKYSRQSMLAVKSLLSIFFDKKYIDNKKEKFLLEKSKLIIFNSLKIIFIISIIFLIISCISYFNDPFYSLIFSFFGVLEASIICIVYLFIRKFLING